MADVRRVQQQLEESLRICKLNILESDIADNEISIRKVNSVFRSLDSVVNQVCLSMESKHPDCHVLMDLWGIAERTLFRLHKLIVSRLKPFPSTVSPWFCTFSVDVPLEVFDLILKRVIQHNSFGHTFTESSAVIKVAFTDLRKAKYIFKRMNDEVVYLQQQYLLKKTFEHNAYAEVAISEEKYMIFKYHKNSES